MAEARLLSLLNRVANLPESASAVECRYDEATNCRGLVTTRACAQGDILLCVPWSYALTVHTAVHRLTALDKMKQRLTRLSTADLLSLCASHDASNALVPRGAGWSLLLTLQLLSELRDKRSPHVPYVATLPVPAGSALAAVSRGPDPGAHLSRCTHAQLECFDCTALMRAVLSERERLQALHTVLFGTDDAAVSLKTFVWAHALIASRAVGLCINSDAPSVRCLLPGIDLCNHVDRRSATVCLRLRTADDDVQAGDVAPSAVELVAARDIPQGTPCQFDYGSHQIRAWVSAYAFVPPIEDGAFLEEPYETIGLGDTGHERLLVTNDGVTATLRLCGIHLTEEPFSITYTVGCSNPYAAALITWDSAGRQQSKHMNPSTEAVVSRQLGHQALAVAEQMADREAHWSARACSADSEAGTEAPSVAELAAGFRAARQHLLLLAAEGLLAHAMMLGESVDK